MSVNIFEKYGIKQVANVYFEALENEPKNGVYKGDIVLFLDTLKVSTIETTAENVAAQGGWGNPRLIQWDYGKEINVTLTDALMSLESLRFMMGGAIKKSSSTEKVIVHRTAEVTVDGNKLNLPKAHFSGDTLTPKAWKGHPIKALNLTTGTRTQVVSEASYAESTVKLVEGTQCLEFKNDKLIGETGVFAADGDKIRLFWDEQVTETDSAVEITISSDTFPGTYRIVGDTFMRNEDGADEPFQFVIERAKVASNVTLTLEAEGDPTTFEMTLNVLRSNSGTEMMKLIRYTDQATSGDVGSDIGSLTTATT